MEPAEHCGHLRPGSVEVRLAVLVPQNYLTALDSDTFFGYPGLVPVEKDSWTLAELAEETGLAPRTIRFYIARGLLNGPSVAGRGAFYSTEHLERLDKIRKLQSRGLMLADIARAVAGAKEVKELPPPEAWQSYRLGGDVVVAVRAGAAPWRLKRIREALRRFAAEVRQADEEGDGSDGNSD
jgi:DNA-binding transcriptional MerR regulator